MSIEAKYKLVEDAKKRHNTAYKFSLIVGLGEDVSEGLRDTYVSNLNNALSSCDKCVRNWHMGRKAYLKDLAEFVTRSTYEVRTNVAQAI